MKLSFPDYNNQHKSQIIGLLGGAAFKKKLWDWQFTTPHRTRWQPVVATNESGKVLGFNAVMPAQVYFDGQLIDAAWSCDFIVAPSCRGKGLGQQIKKKLHKQYPLLFSLGISDQAIMVLEKMGWKTGTSVIAYSKRNYSGGIKGLIIRTIQKINQLSALYTHPKSSIEKFNFRLSSQLPNKQRINQLYEKSIKGYTRTVKRDYDYLYWRYMQHPLAEYDFISLCSHDRLVCLGVVRTTAKQSILVDYLGPKQDAALKLQLIEAWHHYCPEVTMMSCTTSDYELGSGLKKCGFRAAQRQRFYVFGEADNCARRWFIMGGDSDGDILQAALNGMDQR